MTLIVWLVGLAAGLSAVGVVTSRRTIYSALSLVLNMVSLAVLFLLLDAQFLAAVQIIIYAGAVMVLFVFIIALLSPGSGTEMDEPVWRDGRFLVGLVAVLYITIQIAVLANNGTTFDANGSAHTLRGQALLQTAHPGGFDNVTGHNPYPFQYTPANVDDPANGGGNIQTVGESLFTTFLLPFEITSLVLLVAAIGAVYLTRRHRPAPA